MFEYFGRATNATENYRLVAAEKTGLAARLKKTNNKVKRVQSELANANKKQESVRDMRRDLHDAKSRATSLEKCVGELSAAKQRAESRYRFYLTCLHQLASDAGYPVCVCDMRVRDVDSYARCGLDRCVCDICVCMIWIGVCATWIDVRYVDSCVYAMWIGVCV